MAAKKKSKGNGNGNGSEHHEQESPGAVLKAHYEKVVEAAGKLEKAKSGQSRRETLEHVCALWSRHVAAEHEIVIPAMREAGVEAQILDEAVLDHDLVAVLLGDMLRRSPHDPVLAAGACVLSRQLAKLAEHWEDADKGLVGRAKEAGVDMDAMKRRLSKSLSNGEDEDQDTERPMPRLLTQSDAPRTRQGRPSDRQQGQEPRDREQGWERALREDEREMRRGYPAGEDRDWTRRAEDWDERGGSMRDDRDRDDRRRFAEDREPPERGWRERPDQDREPGFRAEPHDRRLSGRRRETERWSEEPASRQRYEDDRGEPYRRGTGRRRYG
jgi:hypothetical protein